MLIWSVLEQYQILPYVCIPGFSVFVPSNQSLMLVLFFFLFLSFSLSFVINFFFFRITLFLFFKILRLRLFLIWKKRSDAIVLLLFSITSLYPLCFLQVTVFSIVLLNILLLLNNYLLLLIIRESQSKRINFSQNLFWLFIGISVFLIFCAFHFFSFKALSLIWFWTLFFFYFYLVQLLKFIFE